jgi:hypothetical protein
MKSQFVITKQTRTLTFKRHYRSYWFHEIYKGRKHIGCVQRIQGQTSFFLNRSIRLTTEELLEIGLFIVSLG